MSDHQFWLSEAQFARLEPLLPNKPRGVPRVDDRRVISGIIHVIRGGLMWRDAPAAYASGDLAVGARPGRADQTVARPCSRRALALFLLAVHRLTLQRVEPWTSSGS